MRKTFPVSYDPDKHLKVQAFLDYIKLNRLDRSEAIRALIEGEGLKIEPLVTRAEIEELRQQIETLKQNGVRIVERTEPTEDNTIEIKQPEIQPVLEVKKEFIRNRYFSNK